MKAFVLKAAVAAVLSGTVLSTHAVVLDFEDLDGYEFFTRSYRGLNFGNNDPQTNPWFYSNLIEPDYPPSSGRISLGTDFTVYTPPPGGQAATLQPTLPISTTDLPFVFNGATFTGFDVVQYELYSGADLVHTSAVSSRLSRTPTVVLSGYKQPVTSVVVRGTQGFYALDDFNYAPVPEPATTALMLAGLGVVGVLARRRRG